MQKANFLKAIAVAGALLSMVAGAGGVSAKPKRNANKILDSLQECQAVTDNAARLACFDSRIQTLKEAREEDKDFAGRDNRKPFEPIDSSALRVMELTPGKWLLVLADNSVWRTTEELRFTPRAGERVKVNKGAFGSFMANINNAPGVRVEPLR